MSGHPSSGQTATSGGVYTEPSVIQRIMRRTTTQSTMQASTQSSKEEPALVFNKYYAYNDLQWTKLKEWLVKTFSTDYPELEYVEDKRDDYFMFSLPRLLTAAERDEIDELRDKVPTKPKRAQPTQ